MATGRTSLKGWPTYTSSSRRHRCRRSCTFTPLSDMALVCGRAIREPSRIGPMSYWPGWATAAGWRNHNQRRRRGAQAQDDIAIAMQALLLTKYGQLEMASLKRPTVGPDDALIA